MGDYLILENSTCVPIFQMIL